MSDRKLAEDHVRWQMARIRKQFSAWACVTEDLMIENFIHGIKHGRELESDGKLRNGICEDPEV